MVPFTIPARVCPANYGSGDAEVHQTDLTRGCNEDVTRAEITVNHSQMYHLRESGCGEVQPVQDLRDNPQRMASWYRLFPRAIMAA